MEGTQIYIQSHLRILVYFADVSSATKTPPLILQLFSAIFLVKFAELTDFTKKHLSFMLFTNSKPAGQAKNLSKSNFQILDTFL